MILRQRRLWSVEMWNQERDESKLRHIWSSAHQSCSENLFEVILRRRSSSAGVIFFSWFTWKSSFIQTGQRYTWRGTVICQSVRGQRSATEQNPWSRWRFSGVPVQLPTRPVLFFVSSGPQYPTVHCVQCAQILWGRQKHVVHHYSDAVTLIWCRKPQINFSASV